MRVTIVDGPQAVAQALAQRVVAALHRRPAAVLGLPTGRTPVEAYAELRRLHAAGEADFAEASTFNLDEFVGVAAGDPGSFRQFMERHLFSGINLQRDRVQFLNGAAANLDDECRRYDAAIAAAGEIDLQILGIGTNGHIGFNEPGAELAAGTHVVTLLESTRRDNAALFGADIAKVPVAALTMGVGSILRAAAIVLVAVGESKSGCIERAVRGPVTTQLPASLLQLHRRVEILVDRDAASRL